MDNGFLKRLMAVRDALLGLFGVSRHGAPSGDPELVELILRNTSDLVAVVDTDGRRQFNNSAYGSVFGDASGLRGTDSFREIHPEDRERVREVFRRTVANGAGERTEYRFLLPDGSVRHIESQGDVIRDSFGKVSRVVILSRDVTERRRLEEQLRQSQKMEALGMLAGGVAHDFNNMIMAINGYAAFILNNASAGPQAHEDAAEIRKAAERAAVLSRQLLAFSRRQVLAPKVVDLNRVAAGMTKMLGRLLGENIEISVSQHVSPVLARVDPGQMEQVLLNLAVNARDAMPNGGKLLIRVYSCEYADFLLGPGPAPGKYAVVSVSDTGTGMDEAMQARVFEPFFTTKKAGKGTGLGLSTVYGIVKQSGGTISLESSPGRGATFTIHLPLTEGAAEDLPSGEAPLASLRGSEAVLLVEDDPVVRSMTRRALKENGYAVLEAASDSEAMLLLKTQRVLRPDLLLADIVLPGINGFELAERAETAFPGIRKVFMSGYTDPEIIRPELLGPDTPFIPKPFTPDELLTVVRRALDAPGKSSRD